MTPGRVEVEFDDDQEFARCIALLTTQLAPGGILEVAAPRTLILRQWQSDRCRTLGICFKQVVPVLSLGDLPSDEAVAVQREALALRDTWADRSRRAEGTQAQPA